MTETAEQKANMEKWRATQFTPSPRRGGASTERDAPPPRAAATEAPRPRPTSRPPPLPDLEPEPEVIPSLGDRIIANAESKEQARTIPKQFSSLDAETLAIGLGALFLVGSRILSRRALGDTTGAMTADEIDHVTTPIARIFLRHLPALGTAKGDATDLIAVICVLGAYSLRLWDLSEERSEQSKRQRTAIQTIPVERPASNGPATTAQRSEWTTPIVFPADQSRQAT